MRGIHTVSLAAYRVLTWLSAAIVFVMLGPWVALSLWWSGVRGCPPDRVTYWLLSWGYRGLARSGWVPITVQGDRSVLQGAGGIVVIANHQSSADIPLLGSLLGARPHVWLYWRRFMHTPFLGFFVRHIGLPVLSPDRAEDARTVIKAVKLIRCGYAVLLFPEGGRYGDHTHPFLGGFELIARKAGCPIVPVYIRGAQQVLPAGKWMGAPHPIEMIIGDPVVLPDQEADLRSSREIVDTLHAWFAAQD